jgi:hypothetical protein
MRPAVLTAPMPSIDVDRLHCAARSPSGALILCTTMLATNFKFKYVTYKVVPSISSAKSLQFDANS